MNSRCTRAASPQNRAKRSMNAGRENVQSVWPPVVEQVPDHLHSFFLRRPQHREPGRPVIASRAIDEVPPQTVACRRNSYFPQAPVVVRAENIVLDGLRTYPAAHLSNCDGWSIRSLPSKKNGTTRYWGS